MSRTKQFFSDLKLRNKFIISYILLLIVPLFLTGVLFYNWFTGMSMEQTGKIASQTMKQAELHIAYIRQEVESLGAMVYGGMDLQEILRNKETTLYKQVEEYETITNIILRMEENPKIRRARFYVLDNKLYARNNQSIFAMSSLQEEPHFRLMVEKDIKGKA
jgi:two-component system sensor histidine kinase YesM